MRPIIEVSQSPQTGQLNSYSIPVRDCRETALGVSIPSNGSIQFLPTKNADIKSAAELGLNPLKRVNSILTIKSTYNQRKILFLKSQSPQTGQFNSYADEGKPYILVIKDESQSPQTGQFNSYSE